MAENLIFENSKQKNEYTNPIRKWVGLSMMILSLLLLVFAIFPNFLQIGKFFYRIFGYSAIVIYLFSFLLGMAMYKRLTFTATKKYTFYIFMSYLSIVSLLHLIFHTEILNNLYVDISHMGNYLSNVYSITHGISVGGVLLSILVYLIRSLCSVAGSYVVYVVSSAIFIGLAVDYVIYNKSIERRKRLYSNKSKTELEEKLNHEKKKSYNDDELNNLPNFSFTHKTSNTDDFYENSSTIKNLFSDQEDIDNSSSNSLFEFQNTEHHQNLVEPDEPLCI